ncbi:MAG: ArnT family glycosyltransferase, partial [Gammaproteobacteria bacterium]
MMQEATITTTPDIALVPWKKKLFDILLLAIGLGIIISLFGYLRPLARPDALEFLETAREMLVNHNWITPTLNNVIQLNYPPLFYWLTALSFKVFGYTLFAARFWPAVFGIIGTITLYLFGCWFAGRRMGWLCALVAASSMLFLTLMTAGAPYLIGSVLFTISICCSFVAALSSSEQFRKWLIVLFWVSCAANCLLLGIAGLILPLFIIIVYSLMMRYQFELQALVSPIGICLFLFITLPWYYLVQQANPNFLSFFFFDSLRVNYLQHFQHPFEKLTWIVFGSFAALSPWAILSNLGYWACKPSSWANRFEKPLGVLILSWIMITAIYLIGVAPIGVGSLFWLCLLTPALSLALAKGLHIWWDVTEPHLFKAARGLLFIVMALLTAFFCMISRYTPDIIAGFVSSRYSEILIWIIYGLFLLGGVAAYFALKSKKGIQATAWVLIATGFITTIIFVSALPRLRDDAMTPITQYITTHQQPGAVIAEYQQYYPEISFTLQKNSIVMIGWQDMPMYGAMYQNTQNWIVGSLFFWHTMQQNKRPLFFIAPKSSLPELQEAIQQNHLQQVAETSQAVLFT